jgi:hypothetical protein
MLIVPVLVLLFCKVKSPIADMVLLAVIANAPPVVTNEMAPSVDDVVPTVSPVVPVRLTDLPVIEPLLVNVVEFAVSVIEAFEFKLTLLLSAKAPAVPVNETPLRFNVVEFPPADFAKVTVIPEFGDKLMAPPFVETVAEPLSGAVIVWLTFMPAVVKLTAEAPVPTIDAPLPNVICGPDSLIVPPP